MRTLLALGILLATAAWSSETRHPRDDPSERSLSQEAIARYAAPYYPAIRECYVTHGMNARNASGELALHVVIHRDGYVAALTVDAPGVTGKRFAALDACVREQVYTWHFPPRRDITDAIIPYYFLHFDIPGAGPHYTCWNPHGCPPRNRPARAVSRRAAPAAP